MTVIVASGVVGRLIILPNVMTASAGTAFLDPLFHGAQLVGIFFLNVVMTIIMSAVRGAASMGVLVNFRVGRNRVRAYHVIPVPAATNRIVRTAITKR